jgi:inhibitor of KinA
VTILPVIRPVGGEALLVTFGEAINEAASAQVAALDRALNSAPPTGFIETVPAFASLMIMFDPLLTDHKTMRAAVHRADLLFDNEMCPTEHVVPICYDIDLAPDISAAADAAGLAINHFAAHHADSDYRVCNYGFAPGYAYLSGIPEAIHLPRKPSVVRNVPAGSVIIAGGQCLITTLAMPTGWWIIGRAPIAMIDLRSNNPFPFAIGDRVRFLPSDRSAVFP